MSSIGSQGKSNEKQYQYKSQTKDQNTNQYFHSNKVFKEGSSRYDTLKKLSMD